MATNKPKVMLPHTMSKSGLDLIRSRDDIEMVIYPAGIPQADLLPQLKDCAGIALSAGSTALARGDLASYAAELRLAVRVKGLHGATLLDNTGKVVLGVNLPADPLPDLALLAHGRQGGVSDLVHGHAQRPK